MNNLSMTIVIALLTYIVTMMWKNRTIFRIRRNYC